MFSLLHLLALLVLAATALVFLMRLVFPLPALDGRQASSARPADPATPLGARLLPEAARHPGLSGIVPLRAGTEAFAARILLARAARTTIDAQYYIWQNDLTGIPLLQELRAAAERGVRVRLLVDDNGTPALDAELAALNALPNFEVRVFNPFNLRRPRRLSYAFDFHRLNRRMHNKSFTVDGAAAIIGGRNIGDVYFARSAGSQYSDRDLLAVGKVVPDVAADFDLYWNSLSAYPHEFLVTPPAGGLSGFDARLRAVEADPGTADYARTIAATRLVRDLVAGALAFDWAETTLLSDDPAKGLRPLPRKRLLVRRLAPIVAEATRSIDVISAYFVPGRGGTRVLTAAAARGVRVRTLTNSLEATDVLPVHASYVKYRQPLLKGGVEVYELRAEPGSKEAADRLGILGKSAASLHAKTLVLDDDRVFVGSFNFDPRSTFLNCEMGFLVRCPSLAAMMRASVDGDLAGASWRVERQPDGRLTWSSVGEGGKAEIRPYEPGTNLAKRVALAVIGLLPVEWLM
ncbi:MAG: phospholipase D family protein [Proteobacteria bacterium]|nr:phospholipase D family protein [Pseudomonadota bacterium]MBS0572673.1 phospholipase D family protein [Pseudomonadota bacterium]